MKIINPFPIDFEELDLKAYNSDALSYPSLKYQYQKSLEVRAQYEARQDKPVKEGLRVSAHENY